MDQTRRSTFAFVCTACAMLAACNLNPVIPVPVIANTTFAPSLGVDLTASTKLSNGEYVRDLVVGTGTTVTPGLLTTVHYSGYLVSGTLFDHNIAPTAPFSFFYQAGEVIPGWDQGFDGVKVGGTRQLIIPPGLAYGAGGAGAIPSNAILIFTVDVLGVQTLEATTFAPALGVDLASSTKLPNGSYYRDLTVGSGTPIAALAAVTAHYTAFLPDGTAVDSNVAPTAPYSFTFGAGTVIAGWDEGLAGVMPGGTRQLILPPLLAYGHNQRGAVPADSILVFNVSVVSVK